MYYNYFFFFLFEVEDINYVFVIWKEEVDKVMLIEIECLKVEVMKL